MFDYQPCQQHMCDKRTYQNSYVVGLSSYFYPNRKQAGDQARSMYRATDPTSKIHRAPTLVRKVFTSSALKATSLPVEVCTALIPIPVWLAARSRCPLRRALRHTLQPRVIATASNRLSALQQRGAKRLHLALQSHALCLHRLLPSGQGPKRLGNPSESWILHAINSQDKRFRNLATVQPKGPAFTLPKHMHLWTTRNGLCGKQVAHMFQVAVLCLERICCSATLLLFAVVAD